MSDSSSPHKPEEEDLQQGLTTTEEEQEYSLKQYALPVLMAGKYVNKSNPSKNYYFISVEIFKKSKLQNSYYPDGRAIVGRIEGNQKLGRVAFRADFIEKYPQLKDITVVRKEIGLFVVVNKPYDGLSFESMLGQRGRPRKKANNQQTASASTT